jgi:hypothetical protein
MMSRSKDKSFYEKMMTIALIDYGQSVAAEFLAMHHTGDWLGRHRGLGLVIGPEVLSERIIQ